MSANSRIEWTDRSWQVTCGCLHKSPGCAHCYAETMAKRLKGMALADIAAGKNPGRKRHYIEAIDDNGHWSGSVVPIPEALSDPARWQKPSMVFVDSMSDLFYGDAEDERRCKAKGIPFTPVPFEFIAKVFAAMALASRHTFQVLTKRAGRMLDWFQWVAKQNAGMCDADMLDANIVYQFISDDEAGEQVSRDDFPALWPLPNVWIGCSAENQDEAVKRHRSLGDVPAAVRFWSLEPLLGNIDALPLKGMNWVIVGGESGHDARPCNLAWITLILAQCREAGVPVFVKQIGSRPELHVSVSAAKLLYPRGVPKGLEVDGFYEHHEKITPADPKGGDPAEWPPSLRIRQFPRVEAAHA